MRMTEDDYVARTETFLDCLIDRLDPESDVQAFPDLLTSLSWTNDDNGHAIELVRRAWLREGDRTRAALALALTETFPGNSRDELVTNLTAAVTRYPELRDAAQAFLERWDAQVEPKRSSAGAPAAAPASAADRPPARSATQPMTTAQAAEFIADHPAPNAPPTFLSEIIDELLPCLRADAQAELFAVRDAWLAGDDEWRAAIAAWMETPAPGETPDALAARRAEVVARLPRVAVADNAQKWYGSQDR